MPHNHERSFCGFAQLAQPAPGGDERLLSKVLRCGEIARAAIGQRADERLIAFDNPAESIAVARPGRLPELLVGNRA